jgi:short subunit dehydrogenase-like uncharacterized protein
VTPLIYGANGYTGELIAREAARRGLRPILAGRNAAAVAALADALALPHRSFPLDDARALDAGLEGVGVVLHCAGPFTATALPMASACLRRRAHYLDITGEVDVFERLFARDAEARNAGVMLLPGAGFDVVPSDCLAAHLKRRLPEATRLTLALFPNGRPSRGTATTMVEHAHHGGLVRRDGVLRRVPAGWKTRRVDFGRGERTVITIPWGDVSTAYHSTGIPNIEVYVAAPFASRVALRATRLLGPVLRARAVKGYLKRRIRAGPAGPAAEARARGRSAIWGEVASPSGARAVSRVDLPDGYELTVRTALAVLDKVIAGHAPAGFQTPSRAYGADLLLEIPGVARVDL